MHDIKDKTQTEFLQMMPEKFQVPRDPIKSYRNYYVSIRNKLTDAKWTKRTKPDWFDETKKIL